jgi:DNA-binding NarL/FixJ family response regulator
MAEAKAWMAQRTPLRVAVLATDTERRADLAARVSDLGHVVTDIGDAEIALADADAAMPELPAVVLGGTESVHAGVLGVDADAAQIDAALRAVAAGLSIRPNREYRFAALEEPETTALLTPREIDVLVALSEGLSNKAVARRLDISQHTVKFHVESIFRKLGVTTRAEAVVKGLRRGLVHL